MKQHKRRLEILSFYDSTGIVSHLESMSQKGWALEKISNNVWHYRRIEPKTLRYSVVYLPSSSEFDPGPTAESQELQAFCAQAGWIQTANQAQMHIFCNEDPQPLPIDTDPELQIEVIHKAMKKNYLPSQFLMLFLGFLQLVLLAVRAKMDPIGFLSQNANLVNILCWSTIIAMSVVDLVKYFRWRKKALEKARDGEFLPTKGSQKFQKFCLILVLGCFFLWLASTTDPREGTMVGISFLLMTLLIVTLFGIKNAMKKRGSSAGTSRTVFIIMALVLSLVMVLGLTFAAITVVQSDRFTPETETYEWNGHTYTLHTDEIPLELSQLMDTGDTVFSSQLYRYSSLLLTHISVSQDPKHGSEFETVLGYNIYDVHFPPLKNLVQENMLRYYNDEGDAFLPVELDIPGVQISRHYFFGEPWNTLLLDYGSRYVLLHPGWEMTPEQIQTAAAILAP